MMKAADRATRTELHEERGGWWRTLKESRNIGRGGDARRVLDDRLLAAYEPSGPNLFRGPLLSLGAPYNLRRRRYMPRGYCRLRQQREQRGEYVLCYRTSHRFEFRTNHDLTRRRQGDRHITSRKRENRWRSANSAPGESIGSKPNSRALISTPSTSVTFRCRALARRLPCASSMSRRSGER